MTHAIIFDCEFLTAEGAPSRFWCGPKDPDPVIAQIGAVRLSLDGDFGLNDTFRRYVRPMRRDGATQPLDPLFSRLTGISQVQVDAEGLPLAEALAAFDSFAGGGRFWSWGKDEFNMIAISCYVEGLAPPIPIQRFGNATELLLKAGMPYKDVIRTRSNTLAAYFGIDDSDLRGHDALDDALSVARVLQHLLRDGRLQAADLAG